MLKKLALVLVLAGLGDWRVEAFGSDLQQIADALNVSSIKTFQFTGSGRMYAVGQNTSPMAAWPRYYVKTLTRQYDFTAGAMREELVRTQGEDPPSGGGGQPLAGDQRTIGSCERGSCLERRRQANGASAASG
jgi:hypothetical protein